MLASIYYDTTISQGKLRADRCLCSAPPETGARRQPTANALLPSARQCGPAQAHQPRSMPGLSESGSPLELGYPSAGRMGKRMGEPLRAGDCSGYFAFARKPEASAKAFAHGISND